MRSPEQWNRVVDAAWNGALHTLELIVDQRAKLAPVATIALSACESTEHAHRILTELLSPAAEVEA